MKKTQRKANQLQLVRTLVRELTAFELPQVAGGADSSCETNYSCTVARTKTSTSD